MDQDTFQSEVQNTKILTQKNRLLQAGGVTLDEEILYSLLVAHPGVSVNKLCTLSSLSRSKTQKSLQSLQYKGMISHSPESTHKYFATPPDVVVDMLILKKKVELEGMRACIPMLHSLKSRSDKNEDERLVEIVNGRELQRRIFLLIQANAQKELLALVSQPYVWLSENKTNNVELDKLKRGLSCRAVYDHNSLNIPDAYNHLRTYTEAGEEARIFPSVPLKLLIVDRRVAFLPLDQNNPEKAALLVNRCALLDALYELFELIWSHAAPVEFTRRGMYQVKLNNNEHPIDMQLVTLLTAGLNDKKIAKQLEISERTLRRHIKALMSELHAKTRFQAGWLLAYLESDLDSHKRNSTI